jgi:hypothetical protein
LRFAICISDQDTGPQCLGLKSSLENPIRNYQREIAACHVQCLFSL